MKKIMDGNEACAYSAYNFTEVAGIYPITPASPMAEYTDKWASIGKENYFSNSVKVVEMESEAGAIGMVHGSLQAGCLTSTYTASQGLLLMIPNMYKIAGELLPCVINVAARSLATHALSIFGDHQDIYAARSTGFAFLASSSVQDAMDLTNVSYLSAIKGKVPFVNFFDGFRTSHELQKIDVIDKDKVKELIDEKALKEFRENSLSPSNPVTRGTNQNEDIYFQATEVRNEYYDKLPDIVNDYMEDINKITGNNYKPFNYYGHPNATKVIVAMGSVCETIKEVVDYLVKEKDETVGLVEVHLYRPFSTKYFLKAIPKSVKKIAVLDRTKEHGSSGEPLYLDVVKILNEADSKVKVVGGRYGLSSKDTTPAMIKGVYDFLDSRDVHSNFTVGIDDDVTHLSISYDEEFTIPNKATEFLVYGYGSDGMVSACKDLMKITGDNTNAYIQGYFKYDSKKSGGYTVRHLRFSNKPIKSEYYVSKASLVVCTKDSYLKKLSMIDKISVGGTFLINTTKSEDELLAYMSNKDKKLIQKNNINLYIINATDIVDKCNLSGKISGVMEALIFKLGKIIDFDFAVKVIKESIESRFKNKSGDIVSKNFKAIDECINKLVKVKIPNVDYDDEIEEKKTTFDLINSLEGDKIPVSAFLTSPDGTFAPATTKLEDRDITDILPCYNSEACLSCNLCSLVCPHAVIRPFLLDKEEVENAPEEVKRTLINPNIKDSDLMFTVGVASSHCTGCGLCSMICPGKNGKKAIELKKKSEINEEEYKIRNDYLFNEVTEKKNVISNGTVKGSQFVKPKFEFSGACAGCGETPYLKLLTQLFGDRLMIANATGCSSIYGASAPNSPYNVAWANSLFEDNAEFGFGMKQADIYKKEAIKNIIKNNIKKVKADEKNIYNSYVNDINIDTANDLYNVIDNTTIEELKEMKDYILPRSVWMIGGDGWAYDIGYNGIDHVLANKENVNILVLDTEVYSNTGGQASKSTRTGAVAKFESNGKELAKKDLLKIALTYPHVYVGAISLGANPTQAIKVMQEAEQYNGPSIIVAYSPCIAQGILKGMRNSIQEEKEATSSGYFPIFHYNPETKEFKMDSKADFSKYDVFLTGEDRYNSLKKIDKSRTELLNKNKKNAEDRYNYYKSLEDKK